MLLTTTIVSSYELHSFSFQSAREEDKTRQDKSNGEGALA
jgi:hypothetical protein